MAGIQTPGSERDKAESEGHKQTNRVSATLKRLSAVPLAITKEEGVFYCTVFIPSSKVHFTGHASSSDAIRAERYGKVKLISEGSNMTLMAQDKIFLGEVKIFYDDPQGLNRIPKTGAVGSLKRHPDLDAFDWDDLGNPIPGSNRKRLTEIISNLHNRHETLRAGAPEEYTIPPSQPSSGIVKELYLDGLENPSLNRVNSVSQEWDLMKRGLRRATQPQKTIKKIKEGWQGFGMMEQVGGKDVVLKNEGGVEFYGINAGGSKDKIIHQKHEKLDPTKILYQNKRFNTFLKHYPSTSIRPIRQWVNSIADLEEGTIRALFTVFSIGALTNNFNDR